MSVKKLSYYEKLKDPRWQKKRLEVMQANDFTCECCQGTEITLNIHHKEYFKGLEPWEYEIEQLACICEVCHESQHDYVDLLKWVCSYAKLDGPNNRTELAFILGGYSGIDYEGMLSFSCLEHCLAYSVAHEIGVKASNEYYDELHSQWVKINGDKNGKD